METRYKKLQNNLVMAGFWNGEGTITGQLVKRVAQKNGLRENSGFLLVRVDASVKVTNKAKEIVEVKAGEIVGVNETAALAPLAEFATGNYDVSITFLGLKDTGKGNPMKDYEIGVANRRQSDSHLSSAPQIT